MYKSSISPVFNEEQISLREKKKKSLKEETDYKEYINFNTEQNKTYDYQIEKYNNELEKLKKNIADFHFTNNKNDRPITPEVIIAAKMLILDTQKDRIMETNYSLLTENEIKIIAMFWFGCNNEDFTENQYIFYIRTEFYRYKQIHKFYLKHLCLTIREYIFDSLNKEEVEAYKNGNYNSNYTKVNNQLSKNIILELNILNKIIDYTRK